MQSVKVKAAYANYLLFAFYVAHTHTHSYIFSYHIQIHIHIRSRIHTRKHKQTVARRGERRAKQMSFI